MQPHKWCRHFYTISREIQHTQDATSAASAKHLVSCVELDMYVPKHARQRSTESKGFNDANAVCSV